MKIGVFTMTVVTLLLLLSLFNSFWLGRLLRPSLRRNFRFAYGLLTLLGAAAYLSIRSAGQFDGFALFNVVFYFGPFWTVLQVMLLVAWPLSKLAGWLQHRWDGMSGEAVCNRETKAPLNPALTRRAFLSYAAAVPPVAMTGINTVGILDAEFRVVLRRIELAYADLPQELDGLKIAHMTDVHIGPYVSGKDVKKMVTLLQQDSPDLLAITGDFVDDVSLLPGVMDTMKPFMASLPLGTWFCMGNHEHRRGAGPIRSVLQQNGVRILDNQHQRLPFGGGHFAIAGVDYPVGASTSVRPEAAQYFMEAACDKIPDKEFTILMAHHPDFLPAAFKRQIGLTLAGHTHGGQVGWGQKSAFEFMYPYMRGVYREEQSFGFVSSGAGHWMPFRFNCPPEVSILTLKRKA